MNIGEIRKGILIEFNPDGFMYKLRHMEFDEKKGKLVIDMINSISSPNNETERLELLSHLWQIPTLVYAYRHNCISNGASPDRYDFIAGKLFTAVREKVE